MTIDYLDDFRLGLIQNKVKFNVVLSIETEDRILQQMGIITYVIGIKYGDSMLYMEYISKGFDRLDIGVLKFRVERMVEKLKEICTQEDVLYYMYFIINALMRRRGRDIKLGETKDLLETAVSRYIVEMSNYNNGLGFMEIYNSVLEVFDREKVEECIRVSKTRYT